MRSREFRQVDVFSSTPYRGNPLAVVLDGDGIDDAAMAAFANWTNLSETTFVVPPSAEAAAAGADYRVRIFTPTRELPFAGHPTLGTAHAWLEAGNEPRDPSAVVQECGVGLVRIRRDGDRLAFAAPALLRSGPIDPHELAELAAVLGISPADVVDANWIDNGPGWSGLLLASADAVLALAPDFVRMGRRSIGVVGPYRASDGAGASATDQTGAAPSSDAGSASGEAGAVGSAGRTDAAAAASDGATRVTPQFEVRGFAGSAGVGEDPVTGSLNASLAQWLMAAGHAPEHYVAAQGARLGRAGHVHLDRIDGQVWVGGASTTCIAGTVLL